MCASIIAKVSGVSNNVILSVVESMVNEVYADLKEQV